MSAAATTTAAAATTAAASSDTSKPVGGAQSSDIHDLRESLSSLSHEALNEDYRMYVIRGIAPARVKEIHGKGSGGIMLSDDKSAVVSVMSDCNKSVNMDMYKMEHKGAIKTSTEEKGDVTKFISPTATSWYNYSSERIDSSKMNPDIQKCIKTLESKHSICFVFSGEFTRYAKPGPRNKKLTDMCNKERIHCHIYDKTKKKYTYLGKLQLVHVQYLNVPINGGEVGQTMYYFSL